MHTPFRQHHLFQLLALYDDQQWPLDKTIHEYFRTHKALGSNDRAFIAEAVYDIVRWQGLLDALDSPPSWLRRYETWSQHRPFPKSFPDLPPYLQVSFPQPLFELLATQYGEEKAIELCLASNTQAPTTVRVNAIKITRDEMLTRWEGRYDVKACAQAPMGITFGSRQALFAMPEFKEGMFEMQDEGSQLLAQLVDIQPGQSALDYCAGSGGKALAFAPQMKQKGQLFLHDIRAFTLLEARKRLKRAGVQNAQVIHAEEESKLKKIKKKIDWVIVDAPCSGVGTLRRNPDMKWKWTPEMMERLVGQQRTIFERALSFLHPEGSIVYMTCSILKQENEEQVEHFIRTYNLEPTGAQFSSLPSEGGMDGFFGCVLRRKS